MITRFDLAHDFVIGKDSSKQLRKLNRPLSWDSRVLTPMEYKQRRETLGRLEAVKGIKSRLRPDYFSPSSILSHRYQKWETCWRVGGRDDNAGFHSSEMVIDKRLGDWTLMKEVFLECLCVPAILQIEQRETGADDLDGVLW